MVAAQDPSGAAFSASARPLDSARADESVRPPENAGAEAVPVGAPGAGWRPGPAGPGAVMGSMLAWWPGGAAERRPPPPGRPPCSSTAVSALALVGTCWQPVTRCPGRCPVIARTVVCADVGRLSLAIAQTLPAPYVCAYAGQQMLALALTLPIRSCVRLLQDADLEQAMSRQGGNPHTPTLGALIWCVVADIVRAAKLTGRTAVRPLSVPPSSGYPR